MCFVAKYLMRYFQTKLAQFFRGEFIFALKNFRRITVLKKRQMCCNPVLEKFTDFYYGRVLNTSKEVTANENDVNDTCR